MTFRTATIFSLMLAASVAKPLFATPTISLSATSLIFNAVSGASLPAAQPLTITSDEAAFLVSYSISYSPSSASSWLIVSPPTPPGAPGYSLPQTFAVYVSPGTLPPGTYAATVTLDCGTVTAASSLQYTVFMTLNGGGGPLNPNETITASPSSLSFSFSPGGALPPAQQLSVATNDGTPFTAAYNTNDINAWLTVSPISSASPGNLTVSVSPATLGVGTYTGTITLTAPSTVIQVPVTLTVGGNGLATDPAMLTINEPQGYGVSGPTALHVTSPLPIDVTATVSSDLNWLQVDPVNGRTPATFSVRANDGNSASGLVQGSYSGMVTVQSSPSNAIQVPVTLVVGAPASLQISPANVSFAWQIGDPLPQPVVSKINSLTSAVQTVTINASTTDGGKWLNASLSPAATPAMVTVSVSPAALTPGTYTAVINVTPSAANASPQPITVSLTVKPAPIPVIQSVNNAASYVAGSAAPGELITIFGSHVGPPALTVPPAGTAPLSFSSTSVTFDAIPAPILFASSTQTGVQVPYGIQLGTTQLKVNYLGVDSAVTKINSVPAFPGLFTANASGQGPLAAFNGDGSLNTASNPVARGSVLVLYGTGEGQTSPASMEGVRSTVIEPLPRPIAPVTVTIGGQTVAASDILYAGEIPGILSGVLQLNIRVPSTVQPGSTIPVVVTVNGQPTQSNITVAVQ